MAERIIEWTAPTGRKLIPGTTFKVEGKGGTWTFIAYVNHPTAPYIECTKSGRAGVRCIRPELVYGVSNRKGGAE
jgi:hypothetical protein